MKKILFVSNPMNCGGIEKALLSLMEEMDYDKYEVFFLPYKEGGEWNDKIPSKVKVLPEEKCLRMAMLYRGDVGKIIKKNLLHPQILFSYLFAIAEGLLIKNMDIARQRYWKRSFKNMGKLPGEYDIAVDFRGEIGSYYLIDKVNAKKKIGWYQGVYSNYSRDREIDAYYWNRLDAIIATVSDGAEDLKRCFPQLEKHIYVFPNIISKRQIERLAEKKICTHYEDDAINIVSVGRLDRGKNYSLAIYAAKEMVSLGRKIRWSIVGDGEERESLKNLIQQLELEREVFLEGRIDNPYPYIKNSVFFVHTSLMEGKPLVIEEAKLLRKIVITTAFPTAYVQIQDKINGFIVPFDAKSIANTIISAYDDCDMRERIICNLRREKIGNEDSIQDLYRIFGE